MRTLVFLFAALCACSPRATPKPSTPAPAPLAKPRGCTADLSSDAHHCGACDHSCLGGACSSGRCTHTVVALEQGDVAVTLSNERFVAWFAHHDDGLRARARTWTASDTVTLGTPSSVSAQSVAISDEHVYWCEDDRIVRAPVTGAATESMAEGCSAIAADGERVAWSTSDGDLVVRESRSMAARRLTRFDVPSHWLRISGSWVFAERAGTMVRVGLSDGAVTPLEGVQHVPVVSGETVFLVESHGATGDPDGIQHSLYAIVRTSFSPSATRTRLAEAQISPFDLSVFGGELHWMDGGVYGNDVVVRKLVLPAGAAEDVLTLPSSARATSLGPKAIVWHQRDAGELRALAR